MVLKQLELRLQRWLDIVQGRGRVPMRELLRVHWRLGDGSAEGGKPNGGSPEAGERRLVLAGKKVL